MRREILGVPFRIGRHSESHLILRDSRTSRNHSEILFEDGEYLIQDLGSRYGTWVNGKRITRQVLKDTDEIEFGVPDSYRLVFSRGAELSRLMDQVAPQESRQAAHSGGANLARLRAVLDVARALQTGFSSNEVLATVVNAALAVTGAERGFLLLRQQEGLEIRVARDRSGGPIASEALKVPRRVIQRALEQRRDLLSMNFDPLAAAGGGLDQSVADLELRSVVCVPLVRIRTGVSEATSIVSAADETVGVLYMDSRLGAADMTGGNRELLQSLALEASTILENARLLEEERAKLRLEEELGLARTIQQNLLPPRLPAESWFRAAGSSVPSRQVGGDYFDVAPIDQGSWSAMVADVSGKGVSAALLASLLQGAFVAPTASGVIMQSRMERLNRFLLERTSGEKYATIFQALLDRGGHMHYINAGHCPPLLVRRAGGFDYLPATAMPVGLMDSALFEVSQTTLADGDKVVVFSDGITEAQNPAGEFFGRRRLREVAVSQADVPCAEALETIRGALAEFTQGHPQPDDMTLLLFEYRAV